jgi:hypothetical protein
MKPGVETKGNPWNGTILNLPRRRNSKSLRQGAKSWSLSSRTGKEWFLWIRSQDRKQWTPTPTSGHWQVSRSVSNEFDLTQIQQKSSFSMTMQGPTQFWGKPSHSLVGQCYPVHPTTPIKHTKISTYLGTSRMESTVHSFRPKIVWFAQWDHGCMSRTRHTHTSSLLAWGCRSGRKKKKKVWSQTITLPNVWLSWFRNIYWEKIRGITFWASLIQFCFTNY